MFGEQGREREASVVTLPVSASVSRCRHPSHALGVVHCLCIVSSVARLCRNSARWHVRIVPETNPMNRHAIRVAWWQRSVMIAVWDEPVSVKCSIHFPLLMLAVCSTQQAEWTRWHPIVVVCAIVQSRVTLTCSMQDAKHGRRSADSSDMREGCGQHCAVVAIHTHNRSTRCRVIVFD